MHTVRNSSRLRGVYLVLGGVPGWGVYLVPGVYLVLEGGVPGPGGGRVSSPPVDRHTCKNITFATSLQTVKILNQKDFCEIWTPNRLIISHNH